MSLIILVLEDSLGVEEYKSQPPDPNTVNYIGPSEVNSIPQHMNMDLQSVGYLNNQFHKVKYCRIKLGAVFLCFFSQ